MRLIIVTTLCCFGLLTECCFAQEETDTSKTPEKIVKAKLGSAKNVHRAGQLWFGGQFAATDLETIKAQGIERIITLRTDGEIDWDEKKAVESAGFEFVAIPFRKPDTLTDEVFDKIRKSLNEKKKKTLFHCGSANRVGGAWLPFRVLDENVELDTAIKEAELIGLRTPFIKEKALDYIDRQKKTERQK